jgi:hypothetical protein
LTAHRPLAGAAIGWCPEKAHSPTGDEQ